ncbi:MAG: ABC transporter permease [Bacteroidetes bacterium]|nr:ABC transporter permease [Bacteroidota bacterium]
MNLAWKIARRYLFAKKSHHLINIISWVSVLGVAVGTFGLVVVLSVFNGFGNLVMSLYNSFDPDIKITPAYGKTFPVSDSLLRELHQRPEIAGMTFVLEDNALLKYMDRQYVVTVKGVSESFLQTSEISSKLLDGEAVLESGDRDFMIAGAQIAYALGARPNDPLHSVQVFMPQKGIDPGLASIDPSSAFAQRSILISGVFGVQQDFDAKYVLVPLRFIQEMTGDSTGLSAMEIKLKEGVDAEEARENLETFFGKSFVVKDRLMQHDFLYKIIKSEKVAVYIILGFILLIAAFNLFGTLTMLILDKRDDLQTLFYMGADLKMARQIFLLEGLLISVGGAMVGMIAGGIICAIQQYFGVIKIGGGEGFVVEAYPVAMQAGDFALVMLIVFSIGFAAAFYTSGVIVTRLSDVRLKNK